MVGRLLLRTSAQTVPTVGCNRTMVCRCVMRARQDRTTTQLKYAKIALQTNSKILLAKLRASLAQLGTRHEVDSAPQMQEQLCLHTCAWWY